MVPLGGRESQVAPTVLHPLNRLNGGDSIQCKFPGGRAWPKVHTKKRRGNPSAVEDGAKQGASRHHGHRSPNGLWHEVSHPSAGEPHQLDEDDDGKDHRALQR
jgi:hypothetical protein